MNEIPFDFRAVSSMKYYMAKQRLERKHSILDAIDAVTQVPKKHDHLNRQEMAEAMSLFRSDVQWV
jgi:hypothetical protein